MILDFFSFDEVSLCSSGWPRTHPVDQAVLKLRASSASQVLGFKLCIHPPFSFLKSVCAHVPTPMETRRCWIPWEQSFKRLGAATWVLGAEPESSARTNALDCCAVCL